MGTYVFFEEGDGDAKQYGETDAEVDDDGEVQLRYDNGDTSSWIKARKLKVVEGGTDKVLLCRDTYVLPLYNNRSHSSAG